MKLLQPTLKLVGWELTRIMLEALAAYLHQRAHMLMQLGKAQRNHVQEDIIKT